MREIRKYIRGGLPKGSEDATRRARTRRKKHRRHNEAVVARVNAALGCKPPRRILETYQRYRTALERHPKQTKQTLLGTGKRDSAWRRAVAVVEHGEDWR